MLVIFGCLLPVTVFAAPRCVDGVLECRDMQWYGEEKIAGMSVKELRSRRKGDKWIAAHCQPMSVEPANCDWKHLGTTGSPAPDVQRPGRALADATEVVASRDPRGKLGPTPAPPREPAAVIDTGPFSAEIAAAAERYKLPTALLRGVLQVESGGNPLAVSHKGAVGLMQLLPDTAKAMGVDDLYDTAQNVMGGARFLRVLANRFDGDLVKVLSAYHAGSTRVLGRDATPFAATDDYVRKVLKIYYQLRDAGERRSAG